MKFVTVFGATSASSSRVISPSDVFRVTVCMPERRGISAADEEESVPAGEGGVFVTVVQPVRRISAKESARTMERIRDATLRLMSSCCNQDIRNTVCSIGIGKCAKSIAKFFPFGLVCKKFLYSRNECRVELALIDRDHGIRLAKKPGIFSLVHLKIIRQWYEDCPFSRGCELGNGAGSRAAHDKISERIDVFQFIVEHFALHVASVLLLRIHFSTTRNVDDIAELHKRS